MSVHTRGGAASSGGVRPRLLQGAEDRREGWGRVGPGVWLRELELVGFKSFAEPVRVELVPGVVVFVGPNGCGKSNLIEAIQWVLGEQSARSLRGDRMEDVLFAGTERRRPAGMAEVTAVLDNRDGTLPVPQAEVRITRRLFRTGKTEYFLNGTRCRARDIRDLVAGVGIGREGYGLIPQGAVERLVLLTPAELKALVEDASGAAPYRERRRRALEELEQAGAAMARLRDIVTERTERLPDLQAQAEHARRVRQWREELWRLEVAALHARLSRARERQAQARREAQRLADEARERLGGRERLGVELPPVRVPPPVAAGRREVAASRAAAARAQRELLARELPLAEARWREALAARQELRISLSRLQEQLASLQGAEAEEEDGDVTPALAELDRVREELERARQGRQEARSADLEAQLLLRRAEEALAASREEERRQGERLAQLQERLSTLVARAEEAESARAAAHAAAAAQAQRVSSLAASLQAAEAELARVEGRLAAVRERLEGGEGHAARGVVAAQKRGLLRGIVGVLADLVTVQPQHLRAIEAALGGGAAHVVVEDEAAAREAISWLTRQRAGRATFLPLSVLRPPALPALPPADGLLGWAASLVQAPEEIMPAVRYALGRTAVVRDLASGFAVARRHGYRLRLATLDGEVLLPGGAVTGGVSPRERALLRWSHEERELAEQERILRERVASVREELREARERWRRLEEVHAARQADALGAQAAVQAVREELAAREAEAARRARIRQEAEGRWQDALAHRQEAERRLSELEGQVSRLEERESSLLQHVQGQEARARERAQREERARWLEAEVERAQGYLARLEADAAQRDRERQALQRRLQQAWEQEARTRLEAAVVRLQEAGAGTVARLARRLQAAAGALERWREGTARRLEREAHDLHVRSETLRAEAEEAGAEASRLQRTLEESYGARPEDAARLPLPPDAEARVARLRQRLAEAGPVNERAEADLAALQENVAALQAQLGDLEAADARLRETVAEADRHLEEQYREARSRLEDTLSRTYPELSGGGRAYLRETDEGLGVVVQPPGRRPVRLELLSGGERAVAGLALLFGMLAVRPCPVYLLDEVEASLDEANVERLARYLRERAQGQFLVVTHRYRTMLAGDALYGITMEEPGVSKVVGVRLTDGAVMPGGKDT